MKDGEWMMEWHSEDESANDELRSVVDWIDEMYYHDDADDLEHGEFYGDDFSY